VRLCRRLVVIDHGRLIHDGAIEDLPRLFGGHRVLVVDLVEDRPLEVAGAREIRSEGLRRWLEFSPAEVSAADLVARVLAAAEVRDLTLEEPDIEDVVRRIYRGEVSGPTPPPRSSGAAPDGGRAGRPRTGS
jgi:ABC-2 type transport system ATP-binding protein